MRRESKGEREMANNEGKEMTMRQKRKKREKVSGGAGKEYGQ